MYSGRAVARRTILYILLIATAVICGWVYLAENYETDFANKILEPIEINQGHDEFSFLQRTKSIPKSAAPVYLRSFDSKKGADFLFFRLPESQIEIYMEKQKKKEGYKIKDIEDFSNNKLCKASFNKVRNAFKVPEYFLPDMKSTDLKFGYFDKEDGSSSRCARLDIYDPDEGHIWYIKRN